MLKHGLYDLTIAAQHLVEIVQMSQTYLIKAGQCYRNVKAVKEVITIALNSFYRQLSSLDGGNFAIEACFRIIKFVPNNAKVV